MNIELSDQAAKRIKAVVGVSNSVTVSRILERVSQDEQLLMSLMVDEPTADDLKAIQEGIDDARRGNVRSLAEFDAEFRSRNK